MKQCTKCKEWKDESGFHKNKRNKDGLRSECKECHKQWSRKYHWDYREKQNQKTREYNKSSLLYNSKTRLELEKYEKVRESENGNVECKCAYDGDWFEPTKQQIQDRLSAINGEENSEGAENKLYCSETCKQGCPIYRKRWYERGYEPATSREVQPALRKMVFARDNYTCQDCNTHKDNLEVASHCHHNEGVQWNPLESADVDKCKTLCKNCHDEFHSQPGYTYKDYQCPPHLKYNT